jgi:ribosomal protein L29
MDFGFYIAIGMNLVIAVLVIISQRKNSSSFVKIEEELKKSQQIHTISMDSLGTTLKQMMQETSNDIENMNHSINTTQQDLKNILLENEQKRSNEVSSQISSMGDVKHTLNQVKTVIEENQRKDDENANQLTKQIQLTVSKIDEIHALNNAFEKTSIDIKNKINTQFEHILQTVNSLKIENYIEVNNMLNKYRKLEVEDKHFVQELGDYKILKIVDKATNEVTDITYENGLKKETRTFKNELPKYATEYENGVLKRGFELDDNGDILFEYEYNAIGEVATSIEYSYTNGTKKIKNKKQY